MHAEPYLFFEGCCEEALTFYSEALGAEVTVLMRYADAPDPTGTPPGGEDKVMHAVVHLGDLSFMASDGRCSGSPVFKGFALTVTLDTPDEARRHFDALAEGGAVQAPLGPTFFARAFGMLTDRFGVPWMVMTPS